eukprot:TRINITY_DN10121_c0_g4_i1.p1 TRINITY_DN10121_c0_g4~~TRINITY_DN10121_c0_g4_i1.p1  ORF type:complete len:402 (+),score=66.54 TRINITY_DN10121_c0_g4_i1:159-1364(+)
MWSIVALYSWFCTRLAQAAAHESALARSHPHVARDGLHDVTTRRRVEETQDSAHERLLRAEVQAPRKRELSAAASLLVAHEHLQKLYRSEPETAEEAAEAYEDSEYPPEEYPGRSRSPDQKIFPDKEFGCDTIPPEGQIEKQTRCDQLGKGIGIYPEAPPARMACVQPHLESKAEENDEEGPKTECWDVCNTAHPADSYSTGKPDVDKEADIGAIIIQMRRFLCDSKNFPPRAPRGKDMILYADVEYECDPYLKEGMPRKTCDGSSVEGQGPAYPDSPPGRLFCVRPHGRFDTECWDICNVAHEVEEYTTGVGPIDTLVVHALEAYRFKECERFYLTANASGNASANESGDASGNASGNASGDASEDGNATANASSDSHAWPAATLGTHVVVLAGLALLIF